MFKAGEVPGGSTCLLQTLQINRPVAWRSSGGSQAELMQILGSQGSTVDDTNYSFILASASYPSFDQYQDWDQGQQWVDLENIKIIGGGTDQAVYVNSNTTTTPYTNDGLLLEAPVKAAGRRGATGVLRNLQVVNFPGNDLAAFKPAGELRAYNVFAAYAGGNCIDLEATANPYRFYGISGGGCNIALNLVNATGMEFHGASFWSGGGTNSPETISITGTGRTPGGYILFDGLQASSSTGVDMFLDQQNETVLCAANCLFADAAGTSPAAAIVIGPDATTTATGVSPIVLQLGEGFFDTPTVRHNHGSDIQFAINSNNAECNCIVALGSGMVDVETKNSATLPGQPTTNDSTKLTGQTTYAPPTLANAGTVGYPQQSLTLNQSELGIATSSSSQTAVGYWATV